MGLDADWSARRDAAADDGAPSSLNLTQPITAAAAVRAALLANPSLRAALETIAAAVAGDAQARLLPNPMATVAFGLDVDGLGGTPFNAALMQQLDWLWQRSARVDASERELERTILEAGHRALEIIASVRATHAALAQSEEVCALGEGEIEVLARLAEIAHARHAAGEGTALETIPADDELARARALLDASRARRARLRFELLAHLDCAASPAAIATDGKLPEWYDDAAGVSDASLVAAARAQRLDVAAALVALAAEEARIDGAARARFPEAGAGAMYMRDDDDRRFIFPQAQLELPIFDTGAAALAGAEATARKAWYDARAVLQTAEREVRSARAEWEAALAAARRSEESAARARRALHLTALARAAGEAPQSALLEAADREIAARRDLSDARLSAALARIELERALGGALPRDDAAPSRDDPTSLRDDDAARAPTSGEECPP